MSPTGSAGPLERIFAAVPPESGAIVMGTGIVSTGLAVDGRETLSRGLLVICAVAWVALALLLGAALLRDRPQVERAARTLPALTGVAATEVLGSRLIMLGWNWAGTVLLVIALVLWLALLRPVLTHWAVPTIGVSFLLTVSTESLAVLSGSVAAAEGARWLLDVALAPFVLGLAFYAFVFARFDFRQLGLGHGDQWITGGALAISTLAAAGITLSGRTLHALVGIAGALKVTTVVLWCLTIVWLPLLVFAEVARPRLAYDVRRWSTVFPVGMYAACSFQAGSAAHVPAITDFAKVWVWVGVAVWVIVFAAMLARGVELARAER